MTSGLKVSSPLVSSPAPAAASMPRHLGAQLLEQAPAGSHLVQFYDDDSFLFETVARFLAAGVAAGDRMLVIATPEHASGIREALSCALVPGALDATRVIFFDARDLLGEFMRGGMPDPVLFRQAGARLLASAPPQPGARLRAFGEMVNLLWHDGQPRAAVRLEELWNDLARENDFSLLCAYTMAHFYREGDSEHFIQVCGAHSHVLPAESFARIESLDSALRELCVLDQRSRLLESEIHSRQEIEHALRDAVEQRARSQADLNESLRREALARTRAEQSEQFKEVFVSALGHDLRNPLNTILTTTRLMALRGELGVDTDKRLQRVIASGVRMERMVEQILDLTRDRLASGISVNRTGPLDLAPLVAKVVEGIQIAHPNQAVETRLTHCFASVDAERFEQVASNLIDNAATHGDADAPIEVTLAERGRLVVLSVRNYGPAIDQQSLTLLFDPFRRARRPVGRSAGLGLGLYISARIVEAHGGEIRVESSEGAGTLFEATFQRDP